MKPIYYLGCKADFIAPIVEAINAVDPTKGRVCDLFSGSGAISAAVALERDVTSVDIQEYARVICSAQINPIRFREADFVRLRGVLGDLNDSLKIRHCVAPLIDFEDAAIERAKIGRLDDIVELIEAPPLFAADYRVNSPYGRARAASQRLLRQYGLLDRSESTVVRHFGGIYFSFEQACWLDAMMCAAQDLNKKKRDVVTAAVLSCASSMVNTVGKQFAQPLRPRDKAGSIKKSIANSIVRDRSIDAVHAFISWLRRYGQLPSTVGRNDAVRGDFARILKARASEFSVIYADPPYTRDHYSRFYHVLETICLHDSPEVVSVKRTGGVEISRGIYRRDRHQSRFCIRSQAPAAFAELFSLASQAKLPIVLSYSPHEKGDGTHPRVMRLKDLVDIGRKFYRRVDVAFLDGSTHNKLNRADLTLGARTHAEVLLLCK